jgi:hypothetical protein
MEERGTEWWEWLPGAATVCSIVTWYGTLAVVGAAMVLWVMFGSFNRAIEIAGFAALVAATIWDWRAKKSRRDG